jgi:two-component system, LuxR family, sensor kinase FixL
MPIARKSVLDDLLRALTHELTQPLTSILSNARAAQHLLASPHLDLEEVQTILEDIASQDKRVGETVRRLGDLLPKPGAARQRLYLDAAVRSALMLVRGMPGATGVVFRMKVDAGLPPVLAHRLQIQRVLVALLHSACEATKRSRANIQRVVGIKVGVAGSMVRVCVEGRGSGVGSEHLERMLQGFFTSAPDGVVLALARCRLILAAYDGYLWAADKPRTGVVFHLAMPIFEGEEP